MAKAVLVTDMPEQVCQKCTLCYETENDDEYLCCATGKLVPDGAKPDWCPLRELPERMEIYGTIEKKPDGTLYTTKAQRTGCSMCGFGIHMEKRPHRFDLLYESNPKEWDYLMFHMCKDKDGNDYGWTKVLDYIGVGWDPTTIGDNCKGQMSLPLDQMI